MQKKCYMSSRYFLIPYRGKSIKFDKNEKCTYCIPINQSIILFLLPLQSLCVHFNPPWNSLIHITSCKLESFLSRLGSGLNEPATASWNVYARYRIICQVGVGLSSLCNLCIKVEIPQLELFYWTYWSEMTCCISSQRWSYGTLDMP